MKTEDTEVLGRQRAKPNKIKARYSQPTCKNCSYHCAPLLYLIKRANFGKLLFRQAWTNFANFRSTASAYFQKLYAYSSFLTAILLLTLFAFK